jgi:hypothetical protein
MQSTNKNTALRKKNAFYAVINKNTAHHVKRMQSTKILPTMNLNECIISQKYAKGIH